MAVLDRLCSEIGFCVKALTVCGEGGGGVSLGTLRFGYIQLEIIGKERERKEI